jgi:hypothetical protein
MSKIQPNIVDYIDTQLIECSRLQSETNEEEPGIFTNTQRSGINIEPGDKISLSSAFVSEIGAGGEVIEFTGEENGDEYTVIYTNSSYNTSELLLFNGENGNPYGGDESEFTNTIPYLQDDSELHYEETCDNVSKTYKVKDNEMNFTTSFYKTTNGEGYFHLPRRFLSGHTFWKQVDIIDKEVGVALQSQKVAQYQGDTYYHSNVDGEIEYEPYGEIITNVSFRSQCKADTHLKEMLYVTATTGVPNASHLSKRNDNSRYQIFQRKKTYWNPLAQSYANIKNIFTTGDTYNYLPDIAMNEYIEYKKLQTLSVDVGMDTPSNVATNLTGQLNKSTITPIKCVLQNSSALTFAPTNPNKEAYIYTNKIETPVFKAFRSATDQSFNQTASRRFYAGASGVTPVSTNSDLKIYSQASLDYFNSYHYIGVKRPELYKTGCDLMRATRGGVRHFEVSSAWDVDESELQINIEWDEINASTGNRYLDDFKDFFESQDLYPELFDYNPLGMERKGSDKVNVSNTKMLHLQPYYGDFADNQLGGDQMVYNGDTGVHTSYPRPDGKPSSQVFISYDRSASNNVDYQRYGHNYTSNLWGGFAFRTYNATDDKYYITFYTDPTRLQDIQNDLFGAVTSGRPIGFDKHFSAYGNSMIALYNGVNSIDYVDGLDYNMGDIITDADGSANILERSSQNLIEDKMGRTYYSGFDKFKFSYLGALSPQISFDTTSDRFTIGGLHSPEHIGNYVSAGAKVIAGNYPKAKATTPDQEVYYINKRLKNNNYCPDMCPYDQTRIMPINVTGAYDTATTYFTFNNNLESGIIYDQFSGIKLNDFGSNKKNWKNNSMFGIMGFDYDLLHPVNASNIQTKYNYDYDKPTTNGLMTSALVQAQETLSQSQNFMEAPFYNYTLPQQSNMVTAYFNYTNPATTGQLFKTLFYKGKVNLPVIVQNTKSAVIRATGLPKKTIRPYYLIRSNIIKQENFIGGRGERIPVIGMVSKINGYSDFYSSVDEGVVFTATKPYTIQNITTSIHTPNGKLANVEDASAVIYKIQKAQNLTTNLSQVIMSQ